MKFLKKIKLPTKYFYFRKNHVTTEEMSEKLFWIPNEMAKPLGCNIFSEDFTWKTILFAMLMTIFLIFTISHFYSLYIFRSDVSRFMFVLITMNLVVQSFGKLYTFVTLRPDIMKTVYLCKSFLRFCENQEMRDCFEKWLLIGFHGEVAVAFCLTIAYIFVVTFPAIIYLVFDSVTLIAGCVIPFTDDQTTIGYTINYTFQSIGGFLTILAFSTALMDVICFLVHFLAFYESLEVLIEKLKSLAKIKKKTDDQNKEIKRILNKIIDGHNMCYEFLDNFESSFMFYHMIEIGASMSATVMSLYAITKVSKLK
jgi:hypothetical protein